jgi:hypothetical protein
MLQAVGRSSDQPYLIGESVDEIGCSIVIDPAKSAMVGEYIAD